MLVLMVTEDKTRNKTVKDFTDSIVFQTVYYVVIVNSSGHNHHAMKT